MEVKIIVDKWAFFHFWVCLKTSNLKYVSLPVYKYYFSLLFSTARIGHTGMKADEIVDNIIAAAEVIAKKLPKVLLIDCIKAKSVHNWALLLLHKILVLLLQNWKNVKILHLKTLRSVALPIFTANISNLDELDSQPSLKKKEVKVKKKKYSSNLP